MVLLEAGICTYANFLLIQNNNDLIQKHSLALDMQTQLLFCFNLFFYIPLLKKTKKNIDNSYICKIYIQYVA